MKSVYLKLAEDSRAKIPLLCLSLAIICIFCHVWLLVDGARKHFANVDEVGHLAASLSHLKYQRFEMYKVNPPLVRTLAAVPAWLSGMEYDWSYLSASLPVRSEFEVGVKRLRAMRLHMHGDYFFPRLVCMSLSILGAIVLTYIAWQWMGRWPAMVALIWWCFSPDILAHGQTIGPDVGSVAFGLLACYALVEYIHSPTSRAAYLVGVALGLALLTKLTWVTGLAMFPLTALLSGWFWRKDLPWISPGKRVTDYGVMCVTALVILNAGYLFEGTGNRLLGSSNCVRRCSFGR